MKGEKGVNVNVNIAIIGHMIFWRMNCLVDTSFLLALSLSSFIPLSLVTSKKCTFIFLNFSSWVALEQEGTHIEFFGPKPDQYFEHFAVAANNVVASAAIHPSLSITESVVQFLINFLDTVVVCVFV